MNNDLRTQFTAAIFGIQAFLGNREDMIGQWLEDQHEDDDARLELPVRDTDDPNFGDFWRFMTMAKKSNICSWRKEGMCIGDGCSWSEFKKTFPAGIFEGELVDPCQWWFVLTMMFIDQVFELAGCEKTFDTTAIQQRLAMVGFLGPILAP